MNKPLKPLKPLKSMKEIIYEDLKELRRVGNTIFDSYLDPKRIKLDLSVIKDKD